MLHVLVFTTPEFKLHDFDAAASNISSLYMCRNISNSSMLFVTPCLHFFDIKVVLGCSVAVAADALATEPT